LRREKRTREQQKRLRTGAASLKRHMLKCLAADLSSLEDEVTEELAKLSIFVVPDKVLHKQNEGRR
jgi:hypothetical protein